MTKQIINEVKSFVELYQTLVSEYYENYLTESIESAINEDMIELTYSSLM